ncbi:MAG: hypothetical protein KDB35_20600, partial [Acidimicrobiales bacterium]|nr:hypothetical protein [Acidimicrobiales bacterium]
EAARVTADIMGGEPRGAWNEALLDVPTTAHILGGAYEAVAPVAPARPAVPAGAPAALTVGR